VSLIIAQRIIPIRAAIKLIISINDYSKNIALVTESGGTAQLQRKSAIENEPVTCSQLPPFRPTSLLQLHVIIHTNIIVTIHTATLRMLSTQNSFHIFCLKSLRLNNPINKLTSTKHSQSYTCFLLRIKYFCMSFRFSPL